MQLPSFGKKIIGSWIEETDWVTSDGNLEGIDLEHTLVLSYSDQSYKTFTVRSWFSNETVEEMAKALGLIPATTPKATRHHKTICSHGCKLNPENTIVLKSGLRRCRKHYLEYNAKRNAERRAKRAAAKGGQK